MDNKKVRSYLRKGELASAMLESLGYRYEEKSYAVPKWVAPAKSELELFKEQLTALMTPPEKRTSPVRNGATFTVTSLPAGHFLQAYMYRRYVFAVNSSEWIAEGSEKSKKLNGFSGWVVHFEMRAGFDSTPRTLWLPLSCIKVTTDADF